MAKKCSTCSGDRYIICYSCNGNGMLFARQFPFSPETFHVCGRCKGEKIIKCPRCGGTGYENPQTRTSEKRSTGCFITSACIEAKNLPNDCYELTTLRSFRDQYVANLPEGKQVIAEYYATAPHIVEKINQETASQKIYVDLYERLVLRSVEFIQLGKKGEAYKNYLNIVKELKRRYL